MVQRMLRLPAVLEADGRSVSAIYDEIARGYYPRPVPIGPKAKAWLESDIQLLQAARIAERDGLLDAFLETRKAERGAIEPWLQKIAERAAQRRQKAA